MSQKEILIDAFKRLDFKKLYKLLDDNKSYMDVSKELFLDRLKEKINHYKIRSYDKVLNGICGSCNKGCVAYKFLAEDYPSLNLFLQEENNEVIDIYICNDLKIEVPENNEWDIYFKFYEEEKVDFKPPLKYSIYLQKVEKAFEEFNKIIKRTYITSNDLVYWYEKHQDLISKLYLDDPFRNQPYKAFKKLEFTYSKVSNIVHNSKKNDIAVKAMKEYREISHDNEKSIVKWLLDYKSEFFCSLKKTDNWKNTGFIYLETEPNIAIDCNECLDSFLFEELYSNMESNMLDKYAPTKEHYLQNGGSVNYNLETFLKLHNKYLDLL